MYLYNIIFCRINKIIYYIIKITTNKSENNFIKDANNYN